VNEQLEFTNEIHTLERRTYVLQAKANLQSLHGLFDKLRNANIYGKSVIVILGDYGSGNSSELYSDPLGASREPYWLEGTTRNFRCDKARAILLVLKEKSQLKWPAFGVERTCLPDGCTRDDLCRVGAAPSLL